MKAFLLKNSHVYQNQFSKKSGILPYLGISSVPALIEDSWILTCFCI